VVSSFFLRLSRLSKILRKMIEGNWRKMNIFVRNRGGVMKAEGKRLE
jgi:hypothetical protein